MRYFKIILNDEIVGVATDSNFSRFFSRHNILITADAETGEYIELNGSLYRDSWMRPLITNDYNFIEAIVREIDEVEYNILKQSLETNEIYVVEEDVPDIQPIENIDTDAAMTIDFIRSSKITEMSRICNQVIEAGFDLQLSDGNTHHFSLTTQDQINLISLGSMAANGMEAIPYHADGEICRFYTAEEITTILAQATAFKIYHTTYYNALKNYINSLDTIEAIAAITYGIELPEEYQSEVLKSLQQ